MLVYISGPITGMPDLNWAVFEDATEKLLLNGHVPFNPFYSNLDITRPWHEHMREALRLLLKAEAVALLPGWERSRGARLEVQVAKALEMTIHPLEDYLEDK